MTRPDIKQDASKQGGGMPVFAHEKIIPYTAALDAHDKEFPFAMRYTAPDGGYEFTFLAAKHDVYANSRTHQLVDYCLDTFKPQAVVVEGLTLAHKDGWDDDTRDFYLRVARDRQQETPEYISEPLHALLSADARGLATYCGEPSDKAQVQNALAHGYSGDDYCCMMFLLIIGHWQAQGIRAEDLPLIWRKNLSDYKYAVTEKLTNDMDSFEHWLTQHTDTKFTLGNFDTSILAPDAQKPAGSLPHLSSTVSRFRDRTILKTIEDALAAHQKVLAVYGGSHFYTLKPALEAAFTGWACSKS
jgi:hypothetical protein